MTGVLAVAIIVGWACILWWIVKDCRLRGKKVWPWVIVWFLLGLLAIIPYLVVRNIDQRKARVAI